MTRQIRRVKLRDQAAEWIADSIASGDYKVGEHLPPERAWVAELGVSRTVVREALNSLESRGLIHIEHGRGAVVSSNGARAVRDHFGFLLRTEPKTLWELMEMRKALEVEVAGLAAIRAEKQDIEAMRTTLGTMRDRIDTPEGYVDADVEFHNVLAKSARNSVFLMMLDSIGHLLLESRRITGAHIENARRALDEHESILGRVEAKDVEGARREMRRHLTATERDMAATFEQEESVSTLLEED